MKSPIGNLKIFFIVFLFFIGIHSAYADATQSPAFKLKAKSALLINAVSGQIVFEQDADKRMPPASLTKLMTLCIALDAVDNGYISM